MTTYQVARFHEQGQDVMIIPMGSAFGRLPASEQQSTYQALSLAAHNAGHNGVVALYWQYGGKAQFISPSNTHAFFQGFEWARVLANLNQTLRIG
jgi:hypothetical protein